VVKYEDGDIADALIADVNAGGNTVGRSISIATILTAYHGNGSTRLREWIDGLTHKQEILDNIERIEGTPKAEL